MRLSIIIPVYNNEKTLERCVTSIISQSFRDYQMILVDDASTDKSPSMCDDFVKADHRIQVVHKKENAGLSEARNTGIRKARGEYITFIDSDDYIQADTLAQLMEILSIHHEYDILEYPVWEHYGNPKKQRRLFLKKNVYINMDEYWFKGKAYMHSYAWNKIYKREGGNSRTFTPYPPYLSNAVTSPPPTRDFTITATIHKASRHRPLPVIIRICLTHTCRPSETWRRSSPLLTRGTLPNTMLTCSTSNWMFMRSRHKSP